MTEAWLRGPVEGVPALLMPVAHSLTDAVEEVEAVVDLEPAALWSRPAGVASVGFHLRHIPGALDRLLTYARGEQLTDDQLRYLAIEGEPGEPPATAASLLERLRRSVADAIDVLRDTPEGSLLEPRGVGRRGLPSNVLGLLFHAAEHTRRHAGQVIATAAIVRDRRSDARLPRGALLAAVSAWEDAGLRGLCADGRLDVAVDALRARGIAVSEEPS